MEREVDDDLSQNLDDYDSRLVDCLSYNPSFISSSLCHLTGLHRSRNISSFSLLRMMMLYLYFILRPVRYCTVLYGTFQIDYSSCCPNTLVYRFYFRFFLFLFICSWRLRFLKSSSFSYLKLSRTSQLFNNYERFPFWLVVGLHFRDIDIYGSCPVYNCRIFVVLGNVVHYNIILTVFS